jgi:hypothetical protein
MIAFNSLTGAVSIVVWRVRGKFYRERGPAYVLYDDATGEALEKGWWRDGVKLGAWKSEAA